MIEVEQINCQKDQIGRILVNDTYSSRSQRKYRTGGVLGLSNQYYTIPNGYKWVINEISGGCSTDNNGCKISLFYAPSGNDQGLQFIDSIFCNGNSGKKNIYYETPVGDGVRAVLMRRERLSTMVIDGSFFYNEER